MLLINDPLIRDMARATTVLVRVLIVDEEFTVLSVAMGLVPGDADEGEDGVCLVEDGVHFF